VSQTIEQIRAGFEKALVDVWGAKQAARLTVEVAEAPAISVLAALAYHPPRGGNYAIGDSLVRIASSYMLKVSPELLAQDDDLVRKVLLHEALHVGYPRHDEHFEYMARKVGTYASEHGMRTGGEYVIELQLEKGARFRPVHATLDKYEAQAFAMQKKAGPGRYRVVH